MFEKVAVSQTVSKFVSKTPMTWKDFGTQLSTDSVFRDGFTNTLCESDFKAFFFETKPFVPEKAAETEFEFVLVKSTSLEDIEQDNYSFKSQFKSAATSQDDTIIFHNLGKDAELVVPLPLTPAPVYSHLALFLRNATKTQSNSFWKHVGDLLLSRMQRNQAQPLWVSTSGLGVYYLHLRLDSSPKYYQFTPYTAHP